MQITPFELFALILSGLSTTVTVSLGAFLLALLVGTISGLILVWGSRPAKTITYIYVEFFRGTSIYFQLFYIYFVLPMVGINLPAIVAGMVALGLNAGAYFSHTTRGAILSVPREQSEAAIALNLTLRQRIRRVILPQAVVIAMPPMGNMAVEILKGSSLVSLIALHDLTYQAMIMRPHLGSNVAPLLSLLVIYYVLSKLIDFGFRTAEARLARGLDTIRS